MPNPNFLSSTLEERSTSFFNTNYVLQAQVTQDYYNCDSMEKLLAQAATNEHLFVSIKAVGLAMFSNSIQAPHLLNDARKDYVKALRLTNKALSDPSTATTDSTLFSVLILSIFETLAGSSQDSLSAWTKHIEGAALLIKLRGPEQFATATGRRLFFHVVANLFISCLQRTVRFPSYIAEMRKKEMPKYMTTGTVGWAASNLTIDFANFRAAIRNREIVDVKTIFTKGMEFEERFINLMSDLPERWTYKTRYSRANPDLIWDGYYHVYQDIWTCQLWNSMRTCRIMLHELIRAALKSGRHSTPQIFSEEEYEIRMADLWSATAKLRDDLLASIPQQLSLNFALETQSPISGFSRNSRPTAHLRGMTGYYAVWQMFVVGELEHTSAKLRSWIIGRLKFIADTMGVKQAAVVANILEQSMPITAWDSSELEEEFGDITLSTKEESLEDSPLPEVRAH